MPKKKEVIGEKHGKLLIFGEFSCYVKNSSVLFVECKCDCGNIVQVRKWDVLTGKTSSCGCNYNKKIIRNKWVFPLIFFCLLRYNICETKVGSRWE